jgi:hypothetical protein
MAQPDGGGNPSEEDRRRARGYNGNQMKSLYDKFQAAVAAYNASPSTATANAMAAALQLLQDAAANGQDPSGQTLAGSLSQSAQQQFQQAQQGGPTMGAQTGAAIATSPQGQPGFQGGLAPAAAGGGPRTSSMTRQGQSVSPPMGSGGAVGGDVGIAQGVAQSLIAQGGGGAQTVTQGSLIPGQGGGPGGPTQGPNPNEVVPVNGQAFGGPGQPDSLGMPHDAMYQNNPGAQAPTGPISGAGVGPNVQLPGNYGSSWQQAANTSQGLMPDGSLPLATSSTYPGASTVAPPPTSGAGVGPNVSLDPNYRVGNQPGTDSAGNPQGPAVTRALAAGMGNDPNAQGASFGGPGQPDSLGSPHDLMPPGSFHNQGGQPPEYANDANSWWAQEGLTTTDIYGGSYDPFDQKNGGFNNVLNAYETSQGLPGYWSDSVGPLMQQAIATSYLGQNPLDTRQEILGAIPQLAQQFNTPGTYYDPTADWTGFLNNPVEGPGGSGQGAFASLSPMDQIGWAAQMWQTIAGQSVDEQYASSGMYQIQQLGEAYKTAMRHGDFTGTFIDYLRANGADSWL